MMHGTGRRKWPPGVGAVLAVLLLIAVVIGCTQVRSRAIDLTCTERRIDRAHVKFDEARVELARHFTERVDSALGNAMKASQDSVQLARLTRSCFGFDRITRRRAIDLIRSNLLFQKLVISNMRDQDPGVVVDLYGNRYRDIFKNDIQ